ncbi:MAG: YHS domain-containing (seleno)protein [Pseudomonadota bacterium]
MRASRVRLPLFAAVFSAVGFGQALAGPQYVDETGYAVSGYDPVAFFSLEQSPVGTPQPNAVPGKSSITTEWNGAKWAFSSEENKAAFVADPEKYAPAYDGHCAYGLAQGGKVPANPNLWRIVDGTLYLNINPPVVGFWEADIPGFIDTADENWSTAEAQPASAKSWTAMDNNKGTYKVVGPVSE